MKLVGYSLRHYELPELVNRILTDWCGISLDTISLQRPGGMQHSQQHVGMWGGGGTLGIGKQLGPCPKKGKGEGDKSQPITGRFVFLKDLLAWKKLTQETDKYSEPIRI